MALLKDLLVSGPSRFIGDVFSNQFSAQNVFSDLIPSQNKTFSLGSSALQWKNIYTDDLSVGDLLSVGRLEVSSGPNTIMGALTINNTLAVKNTATMRNIIPEANNTYEIGSSSARWKNVYGTDLDFSGTGSSFPSHYYHKVYENATTGTNVYVHYYNGGVTSTNTFANFRVKSGSSFKVLRFGGDGTFTWDGKNVVRAATVGVGSASSPVYINSSGIATELTSVGVAKGGTGNTTMTAGRLIYSESATKLSSSTIAVTGNGTQLSITGASGVNGEYIAKRGSYQMFIGFGSGNANHGLYSNQKNDWMIFSDASGNVTVNGNSTTASSLKTAGTIRINLASSSAVTYTNGGNITPGVSGTLPVAFGGTGATTFTSGAILSGNGGNAIKPIAGKGSASQPIYIDSSGIPQLVTSFSGLANGLSPKANINIQTGSSKQQHISFETLMAWLITTKGYIPSGIQQHLYIAVGWSYADNDILQFTSYGTNYEVQLAGCILEFWGSATSYNAGVFRFRIHSSPADAFTVASGYTKVPTSSIIEYFCNGSSYAPTWKLHAGIKTDGSGNLNAAQITGTLPVAHGGTGATTFTSGALLQGNGGNAISAVSATTGSNVKPIYINAGKPTAVSREFLQVYNGGAIDVNTIKDASMVMVQNGTNGPSVYGNVITMPYRKPTGNTTADYLSQIFIPTGDVSTYGNTMYYRTSTSADNYKAWQTVVHHASSTADVGGTGTPVYVDKAGLVKAITAVATAFGGTGNTSFTANRLVYTESATKLASATSIYANTTSVAINKTSITSGYNFEVSGTSLLNSIVAHYDHDFMSHGNEFNFIPALSSNMDIHINWRGRGAHTNDATITSYRFHNGTSSWAPLYSAHLYPGSNNAYDMGTSSSRWRTLYATSVNTSGRVDVGGVLQVTGDTTTAGKLNPNGGIFWNSTSLPEVTSASYLLAIDAFASGGRTKWISVANACTSIVGTPTVTIGAGTASNAPTVSVKIGSKTGTSGGITKATTGLWGVTKLSSTSSTSEETLAATPKGVWAAIDTVKYKVQQMGITANAEYPMLLKGTANTTSETGNLVNFGSKTSYVITANPSTGTITANTYKVTTNGTITYNSANGCIEIIV